MAFCRYNSGMIKITLRIPDEIYQAIKELAEREQRSVNAQILYILIDYLKRIKSQGQQ